MCRSVSNMLDRISGLSKDASPNSTTTIQEIITLEKCLTSKVSALFLICKMLKIPACPVCDVPCRIEPHFGGIACAACAAFFRRTVSLNIGYMCKREKLCRKARKSCRACRFERCVKSAGLQRDYVRQLLTPRNTPLYILNRQDNTGGEIVRAFASPTMPKPEPTPQLGFSDILKVSNSSLFKFYLNQVEKAVKLRQKNTLTIKTNAELLKIVATQQELALEACRTCPGMDLLDKEDRKVVQKYFVFSNVWIESTWLYSLAKEHLETENNLNFDINLKKFIEQVKSTLLFSFSQFKLNIFELAAFKAICIWKLIYHETSRAMKIIAQEHYDGVASALRNYYETHTSMDHSEIAIRIGEITLLVVSIFQLYHDMAKLYVQIGIPF
ncbi:Nuclear hormone receptor family member nhr-217 [Caenorhabditis elegans]|uniref:Nuclear hormone receptor family member nhr-217 n=1 Tax=Caenorhabditis elegans TaxID=6239 RepID=NH217_CAEEL|nr:Nuclear hormone receptor family member nhr-217 [Caenorhabditis elegans]O02305.2 RecName: Full=Nuclear hormone receptor family member nhr-217 [Caenorhabditis elegans]CAB03532.2 Nuclear hormone receptor family member nhr-217 [Caenorhabditis elegans]|eukprot:NP_493122.2 Nuclear hormone receptor family member nhr-217 [Caenorhabditis elegans]